MADVFRLAASTVTTTSAVSLFTVSSASTAILRTLTVLNASTSSTASCDVILSPTLTTDVYLFRFTQISACQTMQPLAGAVTLSPSSRLRFVCSPSNAVQLTASYLDSQ